MGDKGSPHTAHLVLLSRFGVTLKTNEKNRRVFAIAVDGAKVNEAMITQLTGDKGTMQWCVCHRINLSVGDALSALSEIESLITSAKGMVTSIKRSSCMTFQLTELCEAVKDYNESNPGPDPEGEGEGAGSGGGSSAGAGASAGPGASGRLRDSNLTRWSSQLTLLQSVLKHRLQLQKVAEDPDNSLGW